MAIKDLQFSSFPYRNLMAPLFFDLAGLTFVFFVPGIGQLIHLPFYMLEPMRLIVILSVVLINRLNSYILAFTLPLFSWAVSGHPELFKMMIMTLELAANVFLFYYFLRKIESSFFSMLFSIIISKVLCYALYLVFFSIVFVEEEAEPSFLIAQVIMMLIFSFYISIFFRKKQT